MRITRDPIGYSDCIGDVGNQNGILLPDNNEISRARFPYTRIVRLFTTEVGEKSMNLLVIFQPNFFL